MARSLPVITSANESINEYESTYPPHRSLTHHDDRIHLSLSFPNQLQHLIRHIPGYIMHLPRARMTPHHRRLGVLERLRRRRVGGVREIDEDAEAVHFVDEGVSKVTEGLY